ncbi:MAG: hypothetical protein IJ123_05595 [Blautia sp.]|nr:hypothetical protein [Blautia sp.]
MRKHKWLRVLLTVILVILLAAIVAAIVLVGTGRAAKMLEERGITFLSKKETVETADTASTEIAGTETAPAEETAAEAATAETAAEGEEAAAEETVEEAPVLMIGDKQVNYGVTFTKTPATQTPAEGEITSKNCVLINLSDDTIVVANGEEDRISPASMTKVLTLLCVSEYILPDNPGPVTITDDMINYCLSNGLSAAGFENGKAYSVRDLMYGAILPSGGEAVAALVVSGGDTMEEFVELMNNQLTSYGLSDTAHFTDPSGLYDENHYCTLTDIAAVMKAALVSDAAREVLSTKVYTIPATEEGKEDLVLSNWFLRNIEDKDSGGEVIAAKTGFVTQSGYCAVSYEVSASGTPYICVTANSDSEINCINDHVALYKKYAV